MARRPGTGMNARVELPPAREVCPTATRRLLAEGALVVDVRELSGVAQTAFDLPCVLLLPLSELQERHGELPRDRVLVMGLAAARLGLLLDTLSSALPHKNFSITFLPSAPFLQQI